MLVYENHESFRPDTNQYMNRATYVELILTVNKNINGSTYVCWIEEKK